MMKAIKFRVLDNNAKMFIYFTVKLGEEVFLDPTIFSEELYLYTGLKDKNGTEAYHFDIANDKYLLYLDLVSGLYLTDISSGAIIRYKEGIIDEITGNYFEQHKKISENCQRSIDQLISQASRTM